MATNKEKLKNRIVEELNILQNVDTYYVKYKCNNCGDIYQVSFIKGKKADKITTCPNCGCHTGERFYELRYGTGI